MAAAVQTKHWLWCYPADTIDLLDHTEHFHAKFKYTGIIEAIDSAWGIRMYTAMGSVGKTPYINSEIDDSQEYTTLFGLESKLAV